MLTGRVHGRLSVNTGPSYWLVLMGMDKSVSILQQTVPVSFSQIFCVKSHDHKYIELQDTSNCRTLCNCPFAAYSVAMNKQKLLHRFCSSNNPIRVCKMFANRAKH